jgi:hypothetical protein
MSGLSEDTIEYGNIIYTPRNSLVSALTSAMTKEHAEAIVDALDEISNRTS